MILATAAAEVAAAGIAEAPPLDSAHQALGDDLVEALPMLLGNEDPGKHCGIRYRPQTRKKLCPLQKKYQKHDNVLIQVSIHPFQIILHPKNRNLSDDYIFFQLLEALNWFKNSPVQLASGEGRSG